MCLCRIELMLWLWALSLTPFAISYHITSSYSLFQFHNHNALITATHKYCMQATTNPPICCFETKLFNSINISVCAECSCSLLLLSLMFCSWYACICHTLTTVVNCYRRWESENAREWNSVTMRMSKTCIMIFACVNMNLSNKHIINTKHKF